MLVTLPVNVDSYVEEPSPNRNNGHSIRLRLRDDTDHRHFAYLYAAAPFPPGATVVSAVLRFVLSDSWAGSQTVTAKRIEQSWKESRIDFDNRPSVSASNAGSVNLAALDDGDLGEIDLTDLFTDVAGGAAYHGIRLEVDSTATRSIYSSDWPDVALRPVLEIEWTLAPEPPTNLVPAGDRQVSIALPTLAFDADEISALQVQISTSTDFSSPEFDSGKVSASLPYLNLADTAYGGIADGDDRFWRVKVWSTADLESGYSDAAGFGRTDKGALDLINPAADPDDFVEETTPPIIHELTGATQSALETELFRVPASGPLVSLWHDPRTASTDVARAVPAGILREDELYRVRRRVWDDVDRAVTPNDLDYLEVERDFTYERAVDGPSPVPDLIATPDGGSVLLEFTRATAPDYFAHRVDGQLVEDRIEVADVFVSGTSYAYRYWKATPRVSEEHEIEAVVNDAGVLGHSHGNATADAQTNPIGVWLADPTDGLAVFIAGKEKATARIGENAETIYPLGERSPVRITESIRGYEGTWAGIIETGAGRDAYLELKGRLVSLRLIIGDLNIPIMLEEISAIPDKDADRGYAVAFAFFQTDEFTFDVVGG